MYVNRGSASHLSIANCAYPQTVMCTCSRTKITYHGSLTLMRFFSVCFLIVCSFSCSLPFRSATFRSNLLPIDSAQVHTFGQRVHSFYLDYAADSHLPLNSTTIICGKPLGVSIFGNKGRPVDLVLYTFDKTDSCAVYSGVLPSDGVILSSNLPIPSGRYFLRDGNDMIPFERP